MKNKKQLNEGWFSNDHDNLKPNVSKAFNDMMTAIVKNTETLQRIQSEVDGSLAKALVMEMSTDLSSISTRFRKYIDAIKSKDEKNSGSNV